MNQTILTHDKVGGFIGWGYNQLRKKGLKGIVTKLEKMACINIHVEGKGRKAVFSFDIPDSFWMMLMVPNESTPVNVDIMQSLVNANIVMVDGDPLFLLDMEIAAEIAERHGVSVESVKLAMSRMKSHLKKHGMMMDTDASRRCHRIMNKYDTWIKGRRAIVIDGEIRSKWVVMYLEIEEQIANGETVDIASKKHERVNSIKSDYNTKAYRAVKRSQVAYKVINDIEWAENMFNSGVELGVIRDTIEAKKAAYKEEYDAEKARLEAEKQAKYQAMMARLEEECNKPIPPDEQEKFNSMIERNRERARQEAEFNAMHQAMLNGDIDFNDGEELDAV
jgi:hypothetical protein